MKQHGMVNVGALIPSWGLPEPKPKEDRAPKHATPRVVGDPARTPVNRQAANVIAKAGYLCMPPEPPPVPLVDQLKAENAQLRARNENVVKENATLRRRVENMKKLLEARRIPLPAEVKEQKPEPASPKVALLEKLKNGN